MPNYADIARGFARSLSADLLGGFGDTANNVENLSRAGYGYIGSKLGLLSPDQLPELRTPRDAPLTSDWLVKNTPLEDTGTSEYTVGRLSPLVIPLLGGFASRMPNPKPKQLGAVAYPRLALPTQNYSRFLNQETTDLFHETNPSKFEQIITKQNNPFGAPITFLAETPDMALGQAANKGVVLRADPAKLRGQLYLGKPRLDQAYLKGSGEFIAKPQYSDLDEALTHVAYSPESFAGLSKGETRRFLNLIQGFGRPSQKVAANDLHDPDFWASFLGKSQ